MKRFPYQIVPLTEELANKYITEICEAVDQITIVEHHTPEQLFPTNQLSRFQRTCPAAV